MALNAKDERDMRGDIAMLRDSNIFVVARVFDGHAHVTVEDSAGTPGEGIYENDMGEICEI